MKATILASCAAILLVSCDAAKAQGPQLLSPLSGKADNLLIGEIQSRYPRTLCSLTPADGRARLMSFGNEAVVDVGSGPVILAYHRKAAGRGAEFTGKAIEISGNLMRETVTRPYETISHDVTVRVEAGGRVEHLRAAWTCQASLMTVRTAQPRHSTP